MTRIATAAAQHSALADIMRAQSELSQAQRQLSSGKRAEQLKGFGAAAETLVATRAVLARETSYAEAGKRLGAKLEAQAAAIGEISDVASELRQAITGAIGLDDARTLMANLETLFSRATGALNMKFGGAYLFGGGRDDVPPFTGTSLADFTGGAPVQDFFRDGNLRATARLDDGRPLETGVLASELGLELMAAMDRIRDFADANGGNFSDPLTGVERDFLTAEIANIVTVFDSISMIEARNGLMQNQVEAAAGRAGERRDALKGMVSDLEDADMAEVVVRIEQAQLALHASAQAFRMLSTASLLNYLE